MHFKRYEFEFVEQVDGIEEKDLFRRRYFTIGSLTDELWDQYATGGDFDTATMSAKRDVALEIVADWCRHIVRGEENHFLISRQLPMCNLPHETSAAGIHAITAPLGDEFPLLPSPIDGLENTAPLGDECPGSPRSPIDGDDSDSDTESDGDSGSVVGTSAGF